MHRMRGTIAFAKEATAWLTRQGLPPSRAERVPMGAGGAAATGLTGWSDMTGRSGTTGMTGPAGAVAA